MRSDSSSVNSAFLVSRTGLSASTEREEELTELAYALSAAASKAWKQPASFALSVAGAAWTFTSGDPLGAILATGAVMAGYFFRLVD